MTTDSAMENLNRLALEEACWFTWDVSTARIRAAAALPQGRGTFPWDKISIAPMGLLRSKPPFQSCVGLN